MAVQPVVLRKAGGDPEVEIIFGQAQLGVYRSFRWDAQARNPVQVAHGNNADSVLDRFAVGAPAAALDSTFLSWEAIIQTFTPSPGQLFSMTVLVRQDGVVAQGGVVQEHGQFTSNAKSIIGFMMFTVV